MDSEVVALAERDPRQRLEEVVVRGLRHERAPLQVGEGRGAERSLDPGSRELPVPEEPVGFRRDLPCCGVRRPGMRIQPVLDAVLGRVPQERRERGCRPVGENVLEHDHPRRVGRQLPAVSFEGLVVEKPSRDPGAQGVSIDHDGTIPGAAADGQRAIRPDSFSSK